jgi:hypothetical protein
MPLSLETEQIKSPPIVGYRMRIKAIAFGCDEDKPVAITTDCVTLAQLECEVVRLQADLRAILDEARARFASV